MTRKILWVFPASVMFVLVGAQDTHNEPKQQYRVLFSEPGAIDGAKITFFERDLSDKSLLPAFWKSAKPSNFCRQVGIQVEDHEKSLVVDQWLVYGAFDQERMNSRKAIDVLATHQSEDQYTYCYLRGGDLHIGQVSAAFLLESRRVTLGASWQAHAAPLKVIRADELRVTIEPGPNADPSRLTIIVEDLRDREQNAVLRTMFAMRKDAFIFDYVSSVLGPGHR